MDSYPIDMNKRSFFKKASAAIATLGLTPFVSQAKNNLPGRFVHMVFFWMKDPEDTKTIKQFMNGTETFFKQVEVIKTYHIGTPAGTPRDVVDSSYQVSLVVTFDSKEDQDVYQAHQAHLDYIEQYKALWERVQVYDSWA